ncbi:Fic family protein [Curtanaerobium respiraculi]|uniref:Fic family protein n=1 Tax=Curtanaerobium respiraculi TaxID=2949669 RepID=UPI0024B3575B|nr:Fic family protein [Curtanaerobium respiraculi]
MPEFISVAQAAEKWGVSERSVRNYCAHGRVPGAFITGKTWNVPADADKPARAARKDAKRRDLLQTLRDEKDAKLPGGIYHRLQIDLTYNSNHIEGSRLTEDQTRLIFETRTIGADEGAVNIDDVIETMNHFRCIDYVIDTAGRRLTQLYVKRLHLMLKSGTQDASREWFTVGDYKKLPNEVGGRDTAAPEEVELRIRELLEWYEGLDDVGLDDILEFHWRFERIHPFQDGNGRVGRLIMLKECLRYGIVPFVITDELKGFYYRGLSEWKREPGYLEGTALTVQDRFKELLDRFRIPYED